jgi:hypothetical protein
MLSPPPRQPGFERPEFRSSEKIEFALVRSQHNYASSHKSRYQSYRSGWAD